MLHGRYDTQPSCSDLESLVYVIRNQDISCCVGTDLEVTLSSNGFVTWHWSISAPLLLLLVYTEVYTNVCGLFPRFNKKRSSWEQMMSFYILNYWQLNSLLIFTGMIKDNRSVAAFKNYLLEPCVAYRS